MPAAAPTTTTPPTDLLSVRPGQVYTGEEVAALFKRTPRTVANWKAAKLLVGMKTPDRYLGVEILRFAGLHKATDPAPAGETAAQRDKRMVDDLASVGVTV